MKKTLTDTVEKNKQTTFFSRIFFENQHEYNISYIRYMKKN